MPRFLLRHGKFIAKPSDTRVYDAIDPSNCYIDTEDNLDQRFGAEKFERMPEQPKQRQEPAYATPPVAKKPEPKPAVAPAAKHGFNDTLAKLDAMSIKELEALAGEEEVDISAAKGDKKRMTDIIRQALTAAV